MSHTLEDVATAMNNCTCTSQEFFDLYHTLIKEVEVPDRILFEPTKRRLMGSEQPVQQEIGHIERPKLEFSNPDALIEALNDCSHSDPAFIQLVKILKKALHNNPAIHVPRLGQSVEMLNNELDEYMGNPVDDNELESWPQIIDQVMACLAKVRVETRQQEPNTVTQLLLKALLHQERVVKLRR